MSTVENASGTGVVKRLRATAGTGGERAPDSEASGSATLAGAVYRRLRDDIISGRLEPGSWLKLEALRQRYQIGMSPIREALSRLSSDSFVVASENRGFRVAELSRDDLADLTEARVVIECAALRQAIAQGDERWEMGIVTAHYRLSKIDAELKERAGELMDVWEEANGRFHDALVAACESRWVRHFRGLLYDQSKRYRQFSLLRSAALRAIQDEHARLMEATLAREADEAATLLESHMRATARYVMNNIPEQPPPREA